MQKTTKIMIAVCAAVIFVLILVAGVVLLNTTTPVSEPNTEVVDTPNENETETPDTPTGEDEKQPIVIYIPDELQENFEAVGAEVEANSDQAIVDALISANVLPDGCEVLSVTLDGTALTLDMNMVFGNAMRSSGTAGETSMVYALVNTFAQAYGAETVMITVEGGLFETGHQVYDAPLRPTYAEE